jgi:hypothetical protein
MHSDDEPANGASTPAEDDDFAAFATRCSEAMSALFAMARTREEVQFAWALNPEMRGMQDAGWNTAEESWVALDEYVNLIRRLPNDRMRVRVCLSLYSHLSEASGFYEVPKNMLRIASGQNYHLWPFSGLVRKHAETGAIIVPNANKVMKDLVGHAEELDQRVFKEVLLEAFDPDIRNGYAHADYVIWNDGIRLAKRNGGRPSIVPLDEFISKLNKAICFFQVLRDQIVAAKRSYSVPKRIVGRSNNEGAALPTIISYDENSGRFSIKSGMGL